MPSILDLMSPEDKAKAIARGKKRMQNKKGSTISPELYVMAEFGYYFGWEGMLAIKRGYIDKIDGKGNIVKEPFTLEEVLAMLEAVRKVWYSKLIESSHGNLVANSAIYAKSPSSAFKTGMTDFIKKADLNG